MAAPTQNSDASLEELVVSRTSTSTVSSEQTKRRERVPLESSRNAFEEVVPLSTSGSSNYSEPIRRWDVFINHRGLDTKHPLATSIYDALKREGLEVFLDQAELDLGDLIPATIQEAMESSFLHIAILSPRFAESPWCLAELAFMLQTGKHIIPVFYKVDPSDIRWTAKGKGIYAAAFSEHEESNRYSSDKLEEWKLAVQNVSYRTGCYIVEKNDYDEDRQVKDIVSTVLKIVQKRESLWVADYPAGVHNTGIISSGDGNVQAAGKTNYGSSNWTIGGKK